MNTFEFQPNLTGKLVRLRPLVPDDFEPLYQVSSDPLIWEQLPRGDRYKKEVFAKFFEESLSLNTTLAIEEVKTAKLIGSSRYARFDDILREIEIGWTFLARQFWGKGYNSEAKRLMIDHAFQFVDSVFLVCAKTNIRSRKAVEKLGARMECELDWPPGALQQDPSVKYRLTSPRTESVDG